jgi:hypothetical protein
LIDEACKQGKLKTIKYLINHHNYEYTREGLLKNLVSAARNGHVSIIKYLLTVPILSSDTIEIPAINPKYFGMEKCFSTEFESWVNIMPRSTDPPGDSSPSRSPIVLNSTDLMFLAKAAAQGAHIQVFQGLKFLFLPKKSISVGISPGAPLYCNDQNSTEERELTGTSSPLRGWNLVQLTQTVLKDFTLDKIERWEEVERRNHLSDSSISAPSGELLPNSSTQDPKGSQSLERMEILIKYFLACEEDNFILGAILRELIIFGQLNLLRYFRRKYIYSPCTISSKVGFGTFNMDSMVEEAVRSKQLEIVQYFFGECTYRPRPHVIKILINIATKKSYEKIKEYLISFSKS